MRGPETSKRLPERSQWTFPAAFLKLSRSVPRKSGVQIPHQILQPFHADVPALLIKGLQLIRVALQPPHQHRLPRTKKKHLSLPLQPFQLRILGIVPPVDPRRAAKRAGYRHAYSRLAVSSRPRLICGFFRYPAGRVSTTTRFSYPSAMAR
ncbi:hypothetical protein SDC9_109530 [bioreactor metagenome]|uniref:Uncharacterized protein n=1 Tax=bioreactor metagenome TaxID=1076179 RepID=A0A645BHH3_9ZZZZ